MSSYWVLKAIVRVWGFTLGMVGKHGRVFSRDVICSYSMDNKLQESKKKR